MIERFFDELRSVTAQAAADKAIETTPESIQQSNPQTKADESFLAVLPTIRKIVWSRLFAARRDDAPDLMQKVILQLLTWRKNNPNKIEQMTTHEWQSFASKTTYRAVNRFSSSDERSIVSLDDDAASKIPNSDSVAANTQTEVASLLSKFWQGICRLSLRQRRALLLNSESLLVILLLNSISKEKISEILQLDQDELQEIITRLPLSDVQIARIIVNCDKTAESQSIDFLAKSIKKARHEARANLRKLISE